MQTDTNLASHKDLTAREVSEELGLAYDTVRRLLQAGLLPGYRAGKRTWRVTRRALDDFKSGGGVRPQGRPRNEGQADG